MNLVLEAPLSAAFTALGNPAGRAMEKEKVDVLARRGVARGSPDAVGKVLVPDELVGPHVARVQSALQVFGFDCQVLTRHRRTAKLTLPCYLANCALHVPVATEKIRS
jgi:hypothetical protein